MADFVLETGKNLFCSLYRSWISIAFYLVYFSKGCIIILESKKQGLKASKEVKMNAQTQSHLEQALEAKCQLLSKLLHPAASVVGCFCL